MLYTKPLPIYSVRHRLGLSRERFAALLGVTADTIYRHERHPGRQKPCPLFMASWERFIAAHPEALPPRERAALAESGTDGVEPVR